MKRGLILTVVCALLVTMLSGLAGCKQDDTPVDTSNGDTSEFVTLEYWFPVATVPNDIRDVQEELNILLKDKLNCEVILRAVGIGDYESTISLKIAAGDEFDVCYTCPWMNNYADNVRLEAFLPLDEMLPQHAPTIWNTVKPEYWDAARIDGQIYGVINLQILPRQACVSIEKELADAAGFDITTVEKYEDLEPFFDYCLAQGETEVCEMFDVQSFLPYFNWDDMGGSYKLPGFVDATDPNGQVFNQYESEEWKSMMALGSRWYDKGYIKKDILTSYTDLNKICMRMPTTYKPGIEAEEIQYTGREFYVQPIGDQIMYSSWVIGTMNAISQTSQNPVRALQFLELLYSDEEVFNLLCFGIEGEHYTKNADGKVHLLEDSGYVMPSGGWMFGNQFNQWLQDTQEDGIWEETEEINENAVKSSIYGFSFDPTNVKTEIANCTAVYDEYYLPLLLGLHDDPEASYQEFLDKMEAAGASRIIAEKQRQLDEWRASQA